MSLSVALTPAASLARGIDLDTPISVLQQQERTVENLFRDATPSVVYITTFVEKTDRLTMNAVEVPAGTGSGFVWDAEGHVVTNYHVIRGANAAKIAITRGDRSTLYDAALVGYNPDKDVAVLSINSRDAPLTPVSLGSSSALRVGQTTLAIGNPFGLDHSLTVGVVSGLGREVSVPSRRTQQKSDGTATGRTGWPHVPRPVPCVRAPDCTGELTFRTADHQRDSDGRRDQPGQLGRRAAR